MGIRSTYFQRVCAAAGLLLGAGCAQGSAPSPTKGLYSEFLSDTAVREALPALAAHNLALHLNVPSTRIGDAALAALLRDVHAHDVEPRLWLTLPYEDGYWPGEANVTQFRAATDQLLAWLDDEGVAVPWLVVDMEPSFGDAMVYQEILTNRDINAALALLRSHIDPIAFAAAGEAYRQLVADLHARAIKVQCVTLPAVVDDFHDDDRNMGDAMDLPVFDVPWDELVVMVYQTGFDEFTGVWYGPDLIASYARAAREHFGAMAAVALGVVGAPGIGIERGRRYADAASLHADVAAAKAVGMEGIHVYSLDGVLAEGVEEGWLALEDVEARLPEPNPDVELLRDLSGVLDALL